MLIKNITQTETIMETKWSGELVSSIVREREVLFKLYLIFALHEKLDLLVFANVANI